MSIKRKAASIGMLLFLSTVASRIARIHINASTGSSGAEGEFGSFMSEAPQSEEDRDAPALRDRKLG